MAYGCQYIWRMQNRRVHIHF